ncbi:MAG TPA: hypothetical protein VI756_14245 [Blastocatellia bacterium]
MKARGIFITAASFACLISMVLGAAVSSNGQQPAAGQSAHNPNALDPLDTLCSGFISDTPIKSGIRIVGASEELQSYPLTERDPVYINKGEDAGMQPGTYYLVVRPMGAMKQPYTKKWLGYYVKEMGVAKVEAVQARTSRVVIVRTCDEVWLGDELIPYEPAADTYTKEVHAASTKPAPDVTPDPGATMGQIIMSRGFHEYLAANDIVFIDLGSAKGLHPGDSLTIYRTIGMSEGLMKYGEGKIYTDREGGYSGERYKGGDYSIDVPVIPPDEIRKNRPVLPKKVVGQLVLLKVSGNTSVARIVQSSEEVNVGDYVQLNGN